MGLYIFVGLIAVALGALIYLGASYALGGSGSEGVKTVEPPVSDGPPKAVSEKPAAEAKARAAADKKAADDKRAKEEAARQQAEEDRAAKERADAEAAAAPDDPTMYLTVPAMGIYDIPVINDNSEAALTAGSSHLPNTGFPWQAGSNSYIAGHRIGYPGTASDYVFYKLPALQTGDQIILTDSNGKSYTYAVSEFLEVSPNDTWVTNPVAGRDMVSLQTCIENFGDYWTMGPNWFARYIVRADRVS